MIPKKSLEMYFRLARERYQILLKKRKGMCRPWTKDKIFQQYRFCNVFREDDKVTVWIRENYRKFNYANVAGIATCRFFNRIETLEILKQEGLLEKWEPKKVRKALTGVKPLVSAAYIINTSGSVGKSKLEGIIDILTPIWKAYEKGTLACTGASMQQAFERIVQLWYVGRFLAYQIVADLRFTNVLSPWDKNTWAMAGPGTAKGLSLLIGKDVRYFRYGSQKGQAEMLRLLQEILAASRDKHYWPQSPSILFEWPEWEMQETTNWCCEYSKYMRVLDGGRCKQKYPGGI